MAPPGDPIGDHPVDVGALPVGKVIQQYPLAKLLGIAGVIFGMGVGGGIWVTKVETDGVLRAYTAEAVAANKRAEDLQRALAAGTCVKDREGARADAARTLIGKLDMARRTSEHLRRNTLQSPQVPCGLHLESEPEEMDVGPFLDNSRLQDQLVSINFQRIRLNDAIDRTCALSQWQAEKDPSLRKHLVDLDTEFEKFDTLLVGTREYVKASYLRLDPDVP